MQIPSQNLLIYILVSPVLGILLLHFIPSHQKNLLKCVALGASFSSSIGSLLLFGSFNKSTRFFLLVAEYSWFPILNVNFSLGETGLSLFFLLVTTLMGVACLSMICYYIDENLKGFLIYTLSADFFFIGLYCVNNFLTFALV